MHRPAVLRVRPDRLGMTLWYDHAYDMHAAGAASFSVHPQLWLACAIDDAVMTGGGGAHGGPLFVFVQLFCCSAACE